MASRPFFCVVRIIVIVAFVTSDQVHASDATIRVDPLSHFTKYRQGYNITNKHYWTSTCFTGIYGYSVAFLWLLIGIVYGVVRSCNLTTSFRIKRRCFLAAVLFALLFTVLSVVSASVALAANVRFHSRERSIFDAIIGTAVNASGTLDDVANAMKGIQNALDFSNGTIGISTSVDIEIVSLAIEKLEDESHRIRNQTIRRIRLLDKGLQLAYIVTMMTVSLCLATSIILLVCGTLRLSLAVNWLIALCWIINATCWFLFGVYFFFYEFSKDSCTAMESFRRNPYNNSLSSIVPCEDLLKAQPMLSEASEGIYNLVNEVNANLSYTYPDIVFHVCNPFTGPPDYRYQTNSCSMNSIRIGDIPMVLKNLQCSNSNECGGISLSVSQISTVEAYASAIQSLLDAYPRMESLIDCQIVRDAFAEIVGHWCNPLKRDASILWASMAILSVAFTSVVIVWSIQSWHGQRRCHCASSLKPQDSKDVERTTNNIE